MELMYRFNGNGVMAQITDDGVRFDPLQVPDPDREAPLESRAKGGLGVIFVRNVMDRARYRRGAGCNIATLRRHRACTGSQ